MFCKWGELDPLTLLLPKSLLTQVDLLCRLLQFAPSWTAREPASCSSKRLQASDKSALRQGAAAE